MTEQQQEKVAMSDLTRLLVYISLGCVGFSIVLAFVSALFSGWLTIFFGGLAIAVGASGIIGGWIAVEALFRDFTPKGAPKSRRSW